jgi:hypothetical protein
MLQSFQLSSILSKLDQFSCLLANLTEQSRWDECPITARQYGEVVLPDARTGQCPGTPSTRGQKAVTVQGGYGTCFCRHGTNFIAYWRDHGTSLIGAANLSPVTKLFAGTGPEYSGVQAISEPEICHGAGF